MCTALPTNLDNDPTAILRSHKHTNTLQEAFEDELSTLWDGYGIIGDVKLRQRISQPSNKHSLLLQPFTTNFPRADIHELLSPDLLHQVIKGAFKDHLVDWVGQYLESVHGKTGAKEILADIDQRYVDFMRGFVIFLTC